MRPASEADSETLSDIPEESALDGDRARSSSRRAALLATAAAQQSASFVTRAVLLIPLLALGSLATLLLLRWWTRLPRRALPAACSSLVLLPGFLAAPYSGGGGAQSCTFGTSGSGGRTPLLPTLHALTRPLQRAPCLFSAARAQQALHFDYLEARPTAVASFLPARYLVNGQLAPSVPSGARALAPGQIFDLTLTLELPESPVNRDLGVFQVTATLLTSTGDVVAKSSRPAQLRYRSLLARGVRAAARAPLLAVDAAREAQVVTVPLFEGFPESRAAPFAALRVSLASPSGKPTVQVYSAMATLTLRIGWIQYFLHFWPLTSGITVLSTSFIMYASLAALIATLRVITNSTSATHEAQGSDGSSYAYAGGAGTFPTPPVSPPRSYEAPPFARGVPGELRLNDAPSDVTSDDGLRTGGGEDLGDAGTVFSDDTDTRPFSPPVEDDDEAPEEEEAGGTEETAHGGDEEPQPSNLRQRRFQR